MKKTSSFLLVIALLFTMLVPTLTVGITAAELTGTGYTATTDPAGAVASFVKDGTPYYVGTLAEAFAVGAEADNGVTEVTLSAGQTFTLTSDTALDVNAAKTFTLNGNGSTITDDGTMASGILVKITGSTQDTVVTLKNLNICFKDDGKTQNVTTLQVGEDGTDEPVTVCLENVTVTEVSNSLQTVCVRQAGKLIMGNGAKIISNATVGPWSGAPYYALLVVSTAQVLVNTGAEIKANGPAICTHSQWTDGTASTVTINGGAVTSTNNNAIYCTGTLEINGGTITSTKSDAVISLGTTTINGGAIEGNCAMSVNGGTATVNGGTFYARTLACICSKGGARVIINDGYFRTSTEETKLLYQWGLVVAGDGAAPGGKVTVNGGDYYYPQINNVPGASMFRNNGCSDGANEIAINGGNFFGARYIYNADAHGHMRILVEHIDAVEGASVRTVKDESGIRFISTITADNLDEIRKNAKDQSLDNVTYGTVIAPYEYVQQAGGIFTMKALDEANITVGGETVAANKRYVNVVAKDGITTDADGNVTFCAVLIKLHENNLERDFAAIPYVSYVTESGKTVIIYGNFDSTKNVRNMREIAYEALEDVETESTDEYGTLVTEWYEFDGTAWVKKTGTAYSRYSTAQLDVIKAYLPKE